ncbi:transcriptional regulator with XRE-family HTH domain [Enterococcus sp. PF1-24]|uniref:helix-turn-helix domain-containing protein n=1 Tax=unclassified Enterococcus TaxID=2608891 RepID=UPI002476DD1B|nr:MULTISPECIES: helix-turn-helix domain-containing protein [unclassified Enterococcus]MDH6365647.1 transcriptional regulator with XRE-family HTH domain [Enterococcus sp. PFB1-1]MDH6402748.1 transcriptional regulator with XRE-family HTH domain [Enterococcus sp. PF1-24]
MKNVLDIFLKENHMTRYDVSQQANVSEQTLSQASKRDPESLSGKTLIAIAKGTKKTPGEVLDRLLQIRDSNQLYEVDTLSELRKKVREQEDEFLVKGDFRQLVKEIKRSRLSEEVELAANIGSKGAMPSTLWFLNRVLNAFTDDTKMKNLKQDIGDLYQIQFINPEQAKLRLKQLDY